MRLCTLMVFYDFLTSNVQHDGCLDNLFIAVLEHGITRQTRAR